MHCVMHWRTASLGPWPSLPQAPSCLPNPLAVGTTPDEKYTQVATLSKTCGVHFDKGLRPQLVPAVQWLVAMVTRIPEAASEAVQELCGYAGQHLLQHVNDLLKVVVESAPSVSAEVDTLADSAEHGTSQHSAAIGTSLRWQNVLSNAKQKPWQNVFRVYGTKPKILPIPQTVPNWSNEI